MSYPSTQEIRKKLLPVKIGLWLFSALVLLGGFVLEHTFEVSNAFGKSGGLLVAVAVFTYFWLDRKDFLTGRPGSFLGSSGHAEPKKYMALTEAWLVVAGTLVATFGDWFIQTVSEA